MSWANSGSAIGHSKNTGRSVRFISQLIHQILYQDIHIHIHSLSLLGFHTMRPRANAGRVDVTIVVTAVVTFSWSWNTLNSLAVEVAMSNASWDWHIYPPYINFPSIYWPPGPCSYSTTLFGAYSYRVNFRCWSYELMAFSARRHLGWPRWGFGSWHREHTPQKEKEKHRWKKPPILGFHVNSHYIHHPSNNMDTNRTRGAQFARQCSSYWALG